MKIKTLNITGGFLGGALFLHPLSMAFQGLVHPGTDINITGLGNAFSPHHLPMAFFFGIVGAAFGLYNVIYASRLARRDRRVRELEGLLPICAYCKKIREADRPPEDPGAWHDVDRFLVLKSDISITHGMCPDCYARVMEQLDNEEEAVCQ